MNSNHFLEAPAIPSKPYSMFVDNIGILQFGEVAEKPSRLNSKIGANEKLPSNALDLTPQQRESLKKDRIFKLMLGRKSSKSIALPLIKAFFGHITPIKDIALITPQQKGEVKDARDTEVDIVWQETTTGALFILEMQRTYQPHYHNRLSLYHGKSLAALAIQGKRWDYNNMAVYTLSFVDYSLNIIKDNQFIRHYRKVDINEPSQSFTGKEDTILVDLTKVDKMDPILNNEQFNWAYALNNFHQIDELPAFMQTKVFEKVLATVKLINRSKMEELFEFMQEAREMDRKIDLEHATEEGKKEGREEGKKEGREEGIMITIKNFIKSCKEKPTAATLATIFDVKESFVQPLL